MNYYNEFDPFAAKWLVELIKAGLIPNGEVDTRSIVDVRPADLRGFTQCHFFTGIGGWSHALRLAQWPDYKPIWTGSCPCQPFSVAGKRKGKDDDRHLWPVLFQLISECRPPVVMGEQVAGAAGYGWFDGVAADLEREDYASRAVDIPACAVNAPHIRQRLYWCAVGNADRSERQTRDILAVRAETRPECLAQSGLQHGSVGDTDAMRKLQSQRAVGFQRGRIGDTSCGDMADTNGGGRRGRQETSQRSEERGIIVKRVGGCDMADAERGGRESRAVSTADAPAEQSSTNSWGHWGDAEWLTGADGKTRRVKPGVRLLADGIPNRVGKLRGYGNAIVPPLAAEVIKAFMETEIG